MAMESDGQSAVSVEYVWLLIPDGLPPHQREETEGEWWMV